MGGIDIRTLVLILGITHLIQMAVFSLQYKINKTYQGVGWWLLWSASEVVGFIFLLLREIPSLQHPAIIVQNTMLFLGTIFIYIGVMRFLDRQENRAVIISVFLAFITAFVYFVYVHDNIFVRSVIISVALAATSFFTAGALLAYKLPAIATSANFTAAIFIVHGGVFTHRAVMILAGLPFDNIFASSLFNYVPYLDALIVSLLWTFGFIIMLNQRLSADSREAGEHFELIFNTSPDAALITRLTDGVIANVNDGFTTLSGLTRTEAIGKSTLDVNIWMQPADRQKVVREMAEKGFCANMETVFLRKDGSQAVGLLSAKFITLHSIPHIISVTRDITKRKQAEEEIRLLKDQLEQRVLERTSQLEESNKELEAFTYSVSHDLRSPLRAVDGYAHILLEDFGARLDAEGRRICTVISESGRTMGRLIDNLLAFSRIGRTEMQRSTVDMATLAQSVFLELTSPEERERIDFNVATLPLAGGDPALIRQVWENLIGNAVKFSAKKEQAAIEVGCREEDSGQPAVGGHEANLGAERLPSASQIPASEIVYFVRDNGAGFDMLYADKLFRVFHSLHSPGEFESTGAGAGLAIVQRIIHRHAGHIWAEGEVGKGATFYFTLGDMV
jgi:PAS domain S-box-containing protein